MDKDTLERIKKSWDFEEYSDIGDLIKEVERLQEENERLKEYIKYTADELERHVISMRRIDE